jgi:hypothetical protein
MTARYRLHILLAALTFLVGLVVIPVATLPFQGDDLYSRTWGAIELHQAIQQAVEINLRWMNGEGRFFPTSAAYVVAVFHLFDDRYSYHVYLCFLLALLLLFFTFALWVLTRHIAASVSGIALAAATLQFRYWTVDGVTNMAGQITASALLTVTAGIACAWFVKCGKTRAAVASAVMWSLTITTYEVSLLMLPAVLLLIWVAVPPATARIFVVRTLPLIIPTVIDLLVVLFLRSRVSQPSAAYTTNVDGPILRTFLRQFQAAVPSSQYLFDGTPPGLNYPKTSALLILICLGTPLLWALFRGPKPPGNNRGNRALAPAIFLAGAYIWVVPSLLVAVNARWQNDLPVGQGYIYTMYSSLGLTLCFASVVLVASSVQRFRLRRMLIGILVALAVAAAAGTAASNLRYANSLVAGPVMPSDPNQ